jgi:autotransporter-associated beta strand protein
MKTKLLMHKLLPVLFAALTTTAVFGQTTWVFTNQHPTLDVTTGDLGLSTNWNNLSSGVGGNGVPIPNVMDASATIFGDEMLFDGQTTGALAVTQNGGAQVAGGGSGQPYGLRVHLTPNQTSSVTIQSPVAVSGGMRMNYFAIDAGSGGLTLGDHSGNCLDFVAGVLNGQILGLTNNSTTPCVINETVRWRMGGAGSHPHIFTGTGDWIVNNHMRSANQSSIQVQKDGPGTMTWTGTNTANANFPDSLGSPISILNGTMIWKTSDLVGGSAGNPNIVHNGALWKYDQIPSDTGTCIILGSISGTGPIQMNAGTLNLSGQNTISGAWVLSGGTLIAGSPESAGVSGPFGLGGIITFNGGTMTYSAYNGFDYSSRFDTTAGQQYKIDTAGQIVTYATGLSSSGGTLVKANIGQLILSGTSSYSGLTTISGGTLTFEGSKTGTGNITVADGATLGVFDTGTQVTPATLTLGSSVGANLEFDNMNSTTTAPLAPATIVNNGTVIININSGTFHIGNVYPLISWTSGTAPAVSLGIVDGGGGTLSTNGNSIVFNCATVALIWSGSVNGTWDTATMNWTREGSPIAYSSPLQAVFNDTPTTQLNVTMSGVLQPEALTVNNTTNSFSIASSAGNNLAGNVRLGKRGTGTLTLSGGANANTGITTLRGGTVAVSTLSNGGTPSDIGAATSAPTNFVFNGGGLQYNGAAASIDRLFNVAGTGGALDNEGTGALTLNNPGVVTLSGSLTLNGNTAFTNVLGTALIGGGGINKVGTGTWILTGTNGYGGGTVVGNGVLQVGADGGTGSVGSGNVSLASGTDLDFHRTGTVTVLGSISGSGTVTIDGTGTVILANNNSFTGGTTINTGTLQVGNGGGNGSLYSFGAIVNNSLLKFNTSGSFSYSAPGLISGTGNVWATGGGVVKVVGPNTYTGWTLIDAGTTFWPREGQDGFMTSSVVTNNGIYRLVAQDTAFTNFSAIVGSGRVQIGANNVNVGTISFLGTNTYSGGTFIGDNELALGDGGTAQSGQIVGNVTFTNNFTIGQDNPRSITFFRPDSFTFSGNIQTNFATPQVNLGIVNQNGSGTITLTGNNTYGGGTVVNAGSIVVGTGGASGSLGYGPVALNSGTPLLINRSGTMQPVGNISGAADVYITGGATVTLNGAANTYSGGTWVTNGTLFVNGTDASSTNHVYAGGLGGSGTFSGPVVLDPGTTFIPGGVNTIGTLTAQNGLDLEASSISVDINKLLAQSNDIVNVTGTLARTATGGTLTVHNQGPQDLVPGDKFTLFSQPLPNGGSMTVTGGRATWVNNLAVDGSISVATVITEQPTLFFTNNSGGTSITFNWSDPYGSFKLQAQTNGLNVGISGNWTNYPNGGTPPITVNIAKTNATVFFRLISIP